MSPMKNLHVHFDFDTVGNKKPDEELTTRKDSNAVMINYSRDELLILGQSKESKEPPKMVDLISDADEKRKEKVRHILKNGKIWKSWAEKNGVVGGAVSSKGGVGDESRSDQARTNFQQLISAAVSNAKQQNEVYAANSRRIGSGRIVDNFSARDNVYGMDIRYMRNKFFKDDGKAVKNWKSGMEMLWKIGESTSDTDTKSEEPEWANCGPLCKHDIIELHGFDGPEKVESTHHGDAPTESPPARSTPSKSVLKKAGNSEEHFNFEEFLKLDLPASVNSSRDLSAGESRFSQWFARDKLTHSNKFTGNAYDAKSAQQFFEYHQKTSQKKVSAPNKLRSVNELEADLCPAHVNVRESKNQSTNVNAIRATLNKLAATAVQPNQRSMNAAQTNFLLSLVNKSTDMVQYRLSQNVLMMRPDAQLLLHRLVNGEITQFHILQQISNPTIHQHDRETLLGVFAFCNENQQWLVQQKEQQLKSKEQMSQQFRQLQIMQMRGGNFNAPTTQELQLHTQTILNNALYKKQFEDQYLLQNSKPGYQTKFQSFKTNNYYENYQNLRFNRQKSGQNGLQFIQSQNKSLWNRSNQTKFPYVAGKDFMSTSAKLVVSSGMAPANDKISISTEK